MELWEYHYVAIIQGHTKYLQNVAEVVGIIEQSLPLLTQQSKSHKQWEIRRQVSRPYHLYNNMVKPCHAHPQPVPQTVGNQETGIPSIPPGTTWSRHATPTHKQWEIRRQVSPRHATPTPRQWHKQYGNLKSCHTHPRHTHNVMPHPPPTTS